MSVCCPQKRDLDNGQYNNAVIDAVAGAGKYGVVVGSYLAMGAIAGAGLATAPAIAAGAVVIGGAYLASKGIDRLARWAKGRWGD